jgi:ferredoxin-NADP reductase
MATDLISLLVIARREIALDVVELTLGSADGAPLGAWEPGAHIDVVLPNGVERQYSLCGSRVAATWTVAVLREPDGRGGSAYVHDELKVGAEVRARMPRNHFVFDSAGPVLFVAGGIGITPLLSMIEAAEEAGVPWSLAYAGRSRGAMAYLSVLEESHLGRVTAYPADERRLDLATRLAKAGRAGQGVYCCGPGRLIDAAEKVLADAPPGTLRYERFAPRAAEPHREVAFEVEAGGQLLTVPADRSILEVCEEAGMPVLSSCREGTCGTCETPILGGEADHRDSVLTPEEQAENRTMMICVSRARSPRLVLDI